MEKMRGFVVDVTQLRSRRFIVTLYTEEHGRCKGVFHITRQQPEAFLAPLTLLSFQLTGREQQELKTIGEATLESHHFDIAANYLGLTLLQHWAWLVYHSQAEGQEEPRVFRLIDHCMTSLRHDRDPASIAWKNRYFECWLLHFCGVLPRPARTTGNEVPSPGPILKWPALDLGLLRHVFEQRIEEFVRDALKLGVSAETDEVLGSMWEQFLGKDLKIRKLLLKQVKERHPR